MMAPVLPAALWLIASAFLILLLLIVFGYHLYQRSRLAALTMEAGDLTQLAARKERLQADADELAIWLAGQKEELQKLEGERRAQELLRADLAQIGRAMEARKKENDTALAQMADLDVLIVKKRNLLARLEAEVKELESRRRELEPLDKSVQSLRIELETGKIRAALLAEQELKTANLQQLAYALGREIEEMQKSLEPMRQEKNRLHLFIEQARHASSVKNERILEQNEEIRNLELGKEELKRQVDGLTAEIEILKKREEEGRERAAEREKANVDAQAKMEAEKAQLNGQLETLRSQARQERAALDRILQLQEEEEAKTARLVARKTILELELAPPPKRGRGKMAKPPIFVRSASGGKRPKSRKTPAQ